MTRSARPPGLALAAACGVLLAGAPALGQPHPSADPTPGSRYAPIQDGRRVPIPREQTLQRLREAGIARPQEHRAEQLEDLNEISRQLAPDVPVPAPEIEARR
jgi:hypothetical protein